MGTNPIISVKFLSKLSTYFSYNNGEKLTIRTKDQFAKRIDEVTITLQNETDKNNLNFLKEQVQKLPDGEFEYLKGINRENWSRACPHKQLSI